MRTLADRAAMAKEKVGMSKVKVDTGVVENLMVDFKGKVGEWALTMPEAGEWTGEEVWMEIEGDFSLAGREEVVLVDLMMIVVFKEDLADKMTMLTLVVVVTILTSKTDFYLEETASITIRD